MKRILGNKWTTITGFAAGVAVYLSQAGAKLPETSQEWSSLLVGALIAGLGAMSKDAATGSAPGSAAGR